MDKRTVFLAMPVGENIFPETMFNAFYQELPEHIELKFDMESLVIGQPIQQARNLLLERFLQLGYDYIWYLDSDNPPDVSVLKKLIEADKDIVSAIVPLRCNDKETNLLNIFYEDEKGSRQHYTDLTKEKEQVIEISNCGTGCVLIKREVADLVYRAYEGHPFEFLYVDYVWNKKKDKLEKYIFQDIGPDQDDYLVDGHGELIKKKLLQSEDICFFERAKEYGYQIYADITAICYHFFKRPYKRQLLQKDLRVKPTIDIQDDHIKSVVYDIDHGEYPFIFDKKDVVLDIGANVGAFSIWASDKVNTIFAYEPSTVTYNILEKNLKDHFVPNVICRNVAVVGSNHEYGQKVKLYESDNSLLTSTIVSEGRTETECLATSLKLIFEEFDILSQFKITKIKFDIEGGEYDMFDCDIPQSVNEIIGETHILKGERQDKHDRLLQYFKDQGFNVEEKLRDDKETYILHCKR